MSNNRIDTQIFTSSNNNNNKGHFSRRGRVIQVHLFLNDFSRIFLKIYNKDAEVLNTLEFFVSTMENNLRQHMEQNWNMLYAVEEVSLERDFFYNVLRNIEESLINLPDCDIKEKIVAILEDKPADFQEVQFVENDQNM